MRKPRSVVERTNNTTSKRALWARFRAAGGCGDCGIPVERFARCTRCRRAHARWNLRYYHQAKAA